MWAGIDFGSKLAGTTVVCAGKKIQELCFYSTVKNQDADAFLLELIPKLKPNYVCVDAPLSLPGKYVLPQAHSDYFYRQADKELKAMSPMFIGGLTARAIKLKDVFEQQNITVYESYPSGLVKLLNLTTHYNKRNKSDIASWISVFNTHASARIHPDLLPNWHHVDALLCWFTAWRIQQGVHQTFGAENEGLIHL